MKKNSIVISIIIIFTILLNSVEISHAQLYAFNGTERQITLDTMDQFDPHVSTRYIVYADRRNVDADIYVWDIISETELQVTSGGGDQLLTAVWDSLVVFTDYGGGDAEIYLFKGSSTTIQRITELTSNQRRPDIYGRYIVYEDDRNGNYDIYMYNLSTLDETQITTDLSHQRKPAISENIIVWEDFRNGTADVYAYSIGGDSTWPIAINTSAQEVDPDVDGSYITFGSNMNSIGDIFIHNINVGLTYPVTSTVDYVRNPSVSGDFISFESYEAGDANIWVYSIPLDLSEQVTTDSAEQYLHGLCGNRIAYTDNRNDNLDIYEFVFQFEEYICGDADNNGEVNVADLVYMVNYIFKAGPPPEILESADVNASGEINVADLVYMVDYVFKGGPPPYCEETE